MYSEGIEGYVPVKYGSTYKPCPGYDVRVLDNDHNVVPAGTMGNLVIKLPLPPGALQTLYNSEKRFIDSYLTAIPGTGMYMYSYLNGVYEHM